MQKRVVNEEEKKKGSSTVRLKSLLISHAALLLMGPYPLGAGYVKTSSEAEGEWRGRCGCKDKGVGMTKRASLLSDLPLCYRLPIG